MSGNLHLRPAFFAEYSVCLPQKQRFLRERGFPRSLRGLLLILVALMPWLRLHFFTVKGDTPHLAATSLSGNLRMSRKSAAGILITLSSLPHRFDSIAILAQAVRFGVRDSFDFGREPQISGTRKIIPDVVAIASVRERTSDPVHDSLGHSHSDCAMEQRY